MRIGMLLDTPFPPDPRVANEARSLVASGHQVFLFCLNPGGPHEEEDLEGTRVIRYAIPTAFWKKARALLLVVGLYNRWFRRRLTEFIARFGIQVLHVHDLPLVGEGLRAARAGGIPLVADLHENYPAAVRQYAWARNRVGRLLVRPSAWEAYERRVIPRTDRVIVVIDEARDRLRSLGLAPERITIVENTVAVEEFERFPQDAELIRRLAARFTISYLGTFDRHRGIETVLHAAAQVRRQIPELFVVLVGAGPTYAAAAECAQQLGISDIVAFEGWQAFARFPSYVRGSTVCLIPHLKNAHTDTTIPHKLFHYMLLGRPVITTDCAPLARIVRETNAGLVYPSGDVRALGAALVALRDADLRVRLGEAGRKAVLTRYRWDRTAEKLIALYAGLSDAVG